MRPDDNDDVVRWWLWWCRRCEERPVSGISAEALAGPSARHTPAFRNVVCHDQSRDRSRSLTSLNVTIDPFNMVRDLTICS